MGKKKGCTIRIVNRTSHTGKRKGKVWKMNPKIKAAVDRFFETNGKVLWEATPSLKSSKK